MTYEFKIFNDVRQPLPPEMFGGGLWVHLATVVTPPKNIAGKAYPLRFYMAFKDQMTGKVYVERFDPSSPQFFKKIKDDTLWSDLTQFLTEKGLLSVGKDKEFKIVKAEE